MNGFRRRKFKKKSILYKLCRFVSRLLRTADGQKQSSPSNREFVMNDLGHYLFQKTDCAIRRKVGHKVIMSCFGQQNMIYKFFNNI